MFEDDRTLSVSHLNAVFFIEALSFLQYGQKVVVISCMYFMTVSKSNKFGNLQYAKKKFELYIFLSLMLVKWTGVVNA